MTLQDIVAANPDVKFSQPRKFKGQDSMTFMDDRDGNLLRVVMHKGGESWHLESAKRR